IIGEQRRIAYGIVVNVRYLGIASDGCGRGELPVKHRLARGDRAQTDLRHPEGAFTPEWAIVKGSGSPGQRAGSNGYAPESTVARAITHLVLQRGVESAVVSGHGIGGDAGAVDGGEPGILQYRAGEGDVALLAGNVGVAAGIEHE